jgi:hypothetical protein
MPAEGTKVCFGGPDSGEQAFVLLRFACVYSSGSRANARVTLARSEE